MQLNSKRNLQIAIAFFGLVPVAAGLCGVLMGTDFIAGTNAPIPMDSHFRYLSGLLLGIGLTYYSLIPHIEKQTVLFRALTIIVFIGGLARLFGVFVQGIPDTPMLFGLCMETIVTPLLALWQSRVARLYN